MLDEKKSIMKQAFDLSAKMEKETVDANYERRKLELEAQLSEMGVKIAMGKNVDEYGRSREGYEKEMRVIRVRRRNERRAKRAAQRQPDAADPWVGQDGWDSSDESEADGYENFRKDRLKAYKVWKKQICGDVDRDFASVEAVLEPFLDLKAFWKDGYTRAFIQLSLEEVLTPYLQYAFSSNVFSFVVFILYQRNRYDTRRLRESRHRLEAVTSDFQTRLVM